jgi:hypothetical protein
MAVARIKYIEGAYELPISLFFGVPALGAKAAVQIAGHNAFVSLPVLSSEQEALASPKFFERRMDLCLAKTDWGRRWAPGAYVNRVLISGRIPPGQGTSRQRGVAHGDSIRNALRDWIRTALDWLEIMTGHDTWDAEPYPYVRREFDDTLLMGFDDGGVSYSARSKSPTVRVIVRQDGITAKQWRGALTRASKSEQVPLGHSLLLDAQRNLVREHTRRALIDAGTAVEVALSKRLATFGQKKTLGMLVSEARMKGLRLPAATSTKLVDVRNDVAHRGYRPSPAEARSAVKIASRVVRAFAPL